MIFYIAAEYFVKNIIGTDGSGRIGSDAKCKKTLTLEMWKIITDKMNKYSVRQAWKLVCNQII